MRAPRTTLAALVVFFALAPAAAADGLQPPRDLYVEAPQGDQVMLTWESGNLPPAPGERYVVLRDGVEVATTSESEYLDTWLSASQHYSYVVRALDDLGRAADSAPVEVTTPSAAPLEFGPYLQQLTATGVAVVWQTYDTVSTGLRFGPAGRPEQIVDRDPSLTNRHVAFVRGLQPDTVYQYQWESDGALGPVGSFRTPPASPDRFSFDVIGDFGTGSPAARANLTNLSRDSIDFAITVGDNAYPFGGVSQYKLYLFDPLSSFLARKPFWPAVGNHDYYGLANYRRFFALPDKELYYSFNYGGVLFVSLDSNSFGARQRRWARQRLAASSARCKVAFFHHPLWSSGRGYRDRTRQRRRERFVPILQRGGVDLVLNGHVHNYERSKPLWSGHVSRRGIVYIVSGGGGAHLNGFDTRRRPRWSVRRGAFFHRLRISYRGGVLRGKAIDTAGRARDRFQIPCR